MWKDCRPVEMVCHAQVLCNVQERGVRLKLMMLAVDGLKLKLKVPSIKLVIKVYPSKFS